MFNAFTKSVRKLKQCTNLRLHDESYTSIVVSLLIHNMGVRGGGRLFEKGRLFQISADSRGAYSNEALIGGWGGGGGGANSTIYGIKTKQMSRTRVYQFRLTGSFCRLRGVSALRLTTRLGLLSRIW